MATLEELTFLVDSLDDEFIALYDTLSEDSINYMEEFIGWNDMQPLDDFETNYGFVSMRQLFLRDEEEWLDNDDLDMENTPGEKYFYLTLEELTLLNPHGAVVIDDDIIIFTSVGLHIIPNLDYEAYAEYVEDQVPSGINVNKIQNDCVWYSGKQDTSQYEGGKRAIYSLSFHAAPWGGTTNSKVVSYKWSNNKWKKWRTNLAIENQNYYFNNNCESQVKQWFDDKDKKTKKLRLKESSFDAFPLYRASSENPIYSDFYFGNTSKRLTMP